MAGIFYADYQLPQLTKIEDAIRTIPKDWYEKFTSSEDFYKTVRTPRYGFDKIAVGNPENSLDIFSELLSRLFSETSISPDKISYIIDTDYISNFHSPEVSIPHYLQKKYKLTGAGVFTLEQNCGTSLLAVGLASSLVSQKGDYILILSNNTLHRKSRLGPGQIMGDGAGIFVISKAPSEYEIIDFQTMTNGYGSFYNHTKNDLYYPADELTEEKRLLFTNIHTTGVHFIRAFLKKNRLTPDDIHMIIVQPVNRVTFIEMYAEPLGIPDNKIFLHNVPNGGHLGNVDMARNFRDLIDISPPPDGGYIVFLAGAINSIGDTSNNIALVRRNSNH